MGPVTFAGHPSKPRVSMRLLRWRADTRFPTLAAKMLSASQLLRKKPVRAGAASRKERIHSMSLFESAKLKCLHIWILLKRLKELVVKQGEKETRWMTMNCNHFQLFSGPQLIQQWMSIQNWFVLRIKIKIQPCSEVVAVNSLRHCQDFTLILKWAEVNRNASQGRILPQIL